MPEESVRSIEVLDFDQVDYFRDDERTRILDSEKEVSRPVMVPRSD